MPNDVGYVRKALRAAQDELITEIDFWDPTKVDDQQVAVWKERLTGLEGMIARASQETEMHRRQIMVIKSEMQAFERSASATRILDPSAARGVAAQADLMGKDLSKANDMLAEMESSESRLRQASEIAAAKIAEANERLSSGED